MRGRRGSAALLAAGILAGAVACGSGSAAVLHPAGSMSPAPVQAPLPGTGAQHLGSFRFPSDVSIDFADPPPATPVQRPAVTAYQDDVLSLCSAVPTQGKDTTHLGDAGGNA